MTDGEAHHKLGPSTLKWVELCPGYRSSDETNPMAEEGTMLHEAVENESMEGLDDEQMGAVAKCLDYVAPLVTGADEVLKEVRMEVSL